MGPANNASKTRVNALVRALAHPTHWHRYGGSSPLDLTVAAAFGDDRKATSAAVASGSFGAGETPAENTMMS